MESHALDAPPPRGATVLVVEDDPIIQDLVVLTLETEGYQVLVAVGGAALQRAHDAQPAVILLDILMPEMDGVEVSRRLKADPTTAGIPLVAMSTAPDLTQLSAAMQADDVLAKPFDIEDLLATVARWVGGGSLAPLKTTAERADRSADAGAG